MEENIKETEYPAIGDKGVHSMDEFKEFFLNEKERIELYLKKMNGQNSKFGFSITSEKMCLQTSAELFRKSYKEMKDNIIHLSTMAIRTDSNLVVESVDISFNQSELTCFINVKFKNK